MKKKEPLVKYVRTTVQIVSVLILPSLFINIFQSMKDIFMAIFHQKWSITTILPDIILITTITLVTIFAGRFFCGWMCAFGSMGDLIYAIRKKILKKDTNIPKALDMTLKSLKYIFLFGIITFLWGIQIITIPSGVNPWDLFGMLLSVGNWPSMAELTQGWMPATLLLLSIIVGSFFIERFFCRYLCPLGGYFSLISIIRPLNIVKKRKHCGSCSLCTQKCNMGIELGNVDRVHNGECINCMACINYCPRNNAHLELSHVTANSIAIGVVSCTLVAGAMYTGNFTEGKLNLSKTTSSVSGDITNNQDKLSDGTYEGSGTGFRGETTVSVTISKGSITDIQILSTKDDKEYIDNASNQIISQIISTQSAQVDTVSGATYSSNGLIDAINNALAKAGADDSSASTIASTTPKKTEDTSATRTLSEVEDGTYEGSGTGFRGETTVRVTVLSRKITDISILSYKDDQEFFEKAQDTVIENIISNQDVDVDAVSGATYSSNSIMAAVADALNLEYTQPIIIDEHKGHGSRGRR